MLPFLKEASLGITSVCLSVDMKKERSLSAKRKGSTETYVPTKPGSQVARPLSAGCLHQEDQEQTPSSKGDGDCFIATPKGSRGCRGCRRGLL